MVSQKSDFAILDFYEFFYKLDFLLDLIKAPKFYFEINLNHI